MALPAYRRADYIHRTIQSIIGDTITTAAADTYRVYHDYPFGDPGGTREDESDQEATGWVETRFVSGGAGRRGASILQIDVWRRVMGEGDAAGDPFGTKIDEMTDALVEVFSGIRGNGVQKGVFDVLDWSDPLNPVSTDECVLCITTRGDIGEAEQIERMAADDQRMRHVIMRYRFTLLADVARRAFYL